MISYRITKFDPSKRNQEGHYLDDTEWISISDIGESQYRNPSYEEYEQVETAYVEAITLILNEKNTSELEVNSLELYNTFEDFERFKEDGRLKNLDVDFKREIATLKNGNSLSLKEIQKMIRLILRETMWMYLLNMELKIIFGYDYYMYVECSELTTTTINKIEAMGLFVEPNELRRIITVVDENGKEI